MKEFNKEKVDVARKKYKPDNVKYLLIAEAPPDADRFFYFENVKDKDSLFLEMMKVLYLGDKKGLAPYARLHKQELLEKFKNDGFYLEDSVSHPILKLGKIKQIKDNLSDLKLKIKNYKGRNVKIILISATVYKACYQELIKEGYNVINTKSIAFPGSGAQKLFKKNLYKLLNENGFKTKLKPEDV